MSDMLKAGLIRSLAAAPLARAQAPRDVRSEGGFGAQLDAARDSIRDNRESRKIAQSDRAESREEIDEASESDAPDKPREDRDVPVAESKDSAAESGLIAAPIVVVTIAGPAVPVADTSSEADFDLSMTAADAAAPSTTAATAEAPQAAAPQLTTATQPALDRARGANVTESSTEDHDRKADVGVVVPVGDRLNEAAIAVTEAGLPDADSEDESGPPADAITRINRSDTAKSDRVTSDGAIADESASALKQSQVRQESNREVAVDQADAQPVGESMRDVRMGDALARALNGGSRQPAGDGGASHRRSHEQAGLNPASPQANVQQNAPINASATSTVDSIVRSTGVSDITGDATAATIGKFLVGISTHSNAIKPTGDEADRGGAKSNQQSASSTTTSGATASTTAGAKASAPTTAGATFSQILATRLDPASSMEGTARVLAANGGNGRHQVTLRLSPAELGDLRLDVRMQAGVMTLRVDADNAAAGRLIESRLGDLREALSAHGISIERAEVVVRGDASANGGFEHRSTSDDATPRQHSARSDAGDGSWNFNSSHAFTGGDRSGRSDSNPWWMRGDAAGIEMEQPRHGSILEERTLNSVLQNGALDLVA